MVKISGRMVAGAFPKSSVSGEDRSKKAIVLVLIFGAWTRVFWFCFLVVPTMPVPVTSCHSFLFHLADLLPCEKVCET